MAVWKPGYRKNVTEVAHRHLLAQIDADFEIIGRQSRENLRGAGAAGRHKHADALVNVEVIFVAPPAWSVERP